jgi:TaqI-like C-terminal specificity domain
MQMKSRTDDTTAWSWLQTKLPSLGEWLKPFEVNARRRDDQGEYWWELRSCNYYNVFEKPRIHSTKVSSRPNFSINDTVAYAANTSYVLPLEVVEQSWYLLALLNSHVSEWYSRSIFSPKANGYYEVQPVPLSRFPIPDASPAEREAIGALAKTITAEAKARYQLHRRARNRILSDLGAAGKVLNQKLTAWWNLDFPAFRTEIQKVFKRDIALKERDDWDEWLGVQREKHHQHTAAIIAGEVELNRRVYHLFDLNTEEIAMIEASTKYQYGEV